MDTLWLPWEGLEIGNTYQQFCIKYSINELFHNAFLFQIET